MPDSAKPQGNPGSSQAPPDIYEVLLKWGMPGRNVNWLKLLTMHPLGSQLLPFCFCFFQRCRLCSWLAAFLHWSQRWEGAGDKDGGV